MKKTTKLTLGVLGLALVAVGLSSCSASFCTIADQSQVMYAYDVYNTKETRGEGKDATPIKTFGISTYYLKDEAEKNGAQLVPGYGNLYVKYNVDSNLSLKKVMEDAGKQNIASSKFEEFWSGMDNYFLDLSIKEAVKVHTEYTVEQAKENMTAVHAETLLIGNRDKKNLEKGYGAVKYYGDKTNHFANWDIAYQAVRTQIGADKCPSKDFIDAYKNSYIMVTKNNRSCLASKDGFFGYYGFNNENKLDVFMEAKDWKYAWSRGFLEGLLIYPIGYLIDATTDAFAKGVGGGVAQILAIVVITFLIRALMMVFTINQTAQTAKMSEIQPEILKIQSKYPNANTNRSEQQNMALETQALYKKYKIHPFLSILVMIIQFPIFIAVWGAMSGSSVLASDAFLGLRLSDSVMEVCVRQGYGAPGWWTALVVFIIMALFQVASMLLPMFFQKRKQKKLAKTGVNNAMKKQNSTMKWVSIIMMVMVIFMGFSLASGMVIYWIAGSVWSIAQTLIIELITYLKAKNKGKGSGKPKKKHKAVLAGANGSNVVDAQVIPESFAAPTGKKKYKKGSKQ